MFFKRKEKSIELNACQARIKAQIVKEKTKFDHQQNILKRILFAAVNNGLFTIRFESVDWYKFHSYSPYLMLDENDIAYLESLGYKVETLCESIPILNAFTSNGEPIIQNDSYKYYQVTY